MGDRSFREESLPLSCSGEQDSVTYILINFSDAAEEVSSEIRGPFDQVFRELLSDEAPIQSVEVDVQMRGAVDR